MYDIFLSYATADRPRVQPLHDALCQQGWKVFWDHAAIKPGERWPQRIENALNLSHCVVVVWTVASVNSDWVREEATHGKDNDKLLPLRWEDTPPPLGFKVIQTADFRDWNGQPDHPRFQELVVRIRDFVPATSAVKPMTEASSPAPVVQSPKATPVFAPPSAPAIPIYRDLSAFRDRFLNGSGEGSEMVVIPAGSFMMGWVKGRDGDEIGRAKPAHTVDVPRFALGKYPVTVAQFRAFAEATGYQTDAEKEGSCWSFDAKGEVDDVKGNSWRKLGFSQGGQDPVAGISWNDAQAFVVWLSQQTGADYRLPSEAEWEYAARGGQEHLYAGSNDVEDVAWYRENSGKKTHPIGQKQPNAFGLYDMSGNIWEWVQDHWHGSYGGAPSDGRAWEDARAEARVLRGGSWGNYPQVVRAAYRIIITAANRNYVIGFRLARTLP